MPITSDVNVSFIVQDFDDSEDVKPKNYTNKSILETENKIKQENVSINKEINSFCDKLEQIDITKEVRLITSSAKSGHLSENLRVSNAEDISKFWQSDDLIPHSITLFLEKQIFLSVNLN